MVKTTSSDKFQSPQDGDRPCRPGAPVFYVYSLDVVSIPSRRGQALQASVPLAVASARHASIPSRRGQALQEIIIPATDVLSPGFNPLKTGTGPAGPPAQESPMPKSSFNPLKTGTGPAGLREHHLHRTQRKVSIPSRRGQALQGGRSRDGGLPGKVSIPSRRGQALQEVDTRLVAFAWEFQSPQDGDRPCRVEEMIRSWPFPGFNPLKTGTGPAGGGGDDQVLAVPVSIPSRRGQALQVRRSWTPVRRAVSGFNPLKTGTGPAGLTLVSATGEHTGFNPLKTGTGPAGAAHGGSG